MWRAQRSVSIAVSVDSVSINDHIALPINILEV